MKIKVVVSDFHLGKGRTFRDGTQNVLEDFIYDREFSEFLEHYCQPPFDTAEVELVLNGDILNLLQMDSWGVHTHLITERATVRAVQKIIQGHPEFFEALQRFLKVPGHSITYVIGNHDAGMLFQGARHAFNLAVGTEIRYIDTSYQFDGIHIEHGQQYEEFARMDMDRTFLKRDFAEPVLNLPWGSLFTAIVLSGLKQERPAIDKVKPINVFIRWVLIHDFFWALKAGLRVFQFAVKTILFRRRFQIRQSLKGTFKMLQEISVYPNYDKIAYRILADDPQLSTVIFGHTHILRHRRWKEGKEYFNEGTWNETTNMDLGELGTIRRLTYAYIEYFESADGSGLKPKVRLKQWHGEWRPESDLLL